jgi:hypothetical protein
MKNKPTPLLLLAAWLLTLSAAPGQTRFGFQYDQRPTLSVDGRSLPNAWAGGLNSSQFAQTRLNDDPRPDLVVFDRTSHKISTFLATDAGWQHAPDYETAFPAMQSWFALADYDNDGLTDLFTPTDLGIGVFRHVRVNGRPTWQVVVNPLTVIGISGTYPVYVAASDVPAVVDYDADGDVDILAFDGSGNRVVYLKNVATETKNPSRLAFKQMGECWGNFRKEYCNDVTFDLDCAATFGQRPGSGAARAGHTGNSLTVLDTDGDGRTDVLYGFVSCTNLTRLRNVGPNSEYARFVSADTLFPARNPIDMSIFPAGFVVDADRDGLADLLASPNIQSNDAAGSTDFAASNWFYRNTGTARQPDFRLVQTNFLQDDMLDLGEDAAPALADLDGDGDLDLLVGSRGQNTSFGLRATLQLYTNNGTPSQANFVLTNPNYLDLPVELMASNIVPAFADVDNNGTPDLVLTLTTPATGPQIRLLLNTAPSANTFARYSFANARPITLADPLRLGDRPTVTDIDRDGLPDLLIGNVSGGISYYRNTGTATNPTYTRQTRTFGGLTNSAASQYLSIAVADLNGDRTAELLTATRDGAVRLYALPSQPTGPLVLLDSLRSLGKPGAGLVAAIGDLDGDALPDLLLGTLSGGIRLLKNTSQKVIVTAVEPLPGLRADLPWAYPNPTTGALTVKPPFNGMLDVLDLAGQVVQPARPVQRDQLVTLSLADLPDGVYLLRLSADGQPSLVEKIVLWK